MKGRQAQAHPHHYYHLLLHCMYKYIVSHKRRISQWARHEHTIGWKKVLFFLFLSFCLPRGISELAWERVETWILTDPSPRRPHLLEVRYILYPI
jgi:hypothetical protein